MFVSQTSLGKLMTTIENAEPFFIFCLRSNNQKVTPGWRTAERHDAVKEVM